jgi:hypothetical protein
MNDLISLEKIAQWQKLKTLVLDEARVQHGAGGVYGLVPSKRRGPASPRH